MYISVLNPPGGPSKRYSDISTHSAFTTETPTTPPRTPSPGMCSSPDRPKHLDVPPARDYEVGRKSRSLRRARSAERTRTWAEEVQRQRSRDERNGKRREQEERHLKIGEGEGSLSSRKIWSVSTGVIDSLVHDYSSKTRYSSRLPSADEVISNLNRARRPTPESSDSEGYDIAHRESIKVKSRSSSKSRARSRVIPPIVPLRQSSVQGAAPVVLAQSPQRTLVSAPLNPAATTTVHSGSKSSISSPKVPLRSSSRPTGPGQSLSKANTTALSIDDIVRKHSSAVEEAVQNACNSAKRSIGTPSHAPSSVKDDKSMEALPKPAQSKSPKTARNPTTQVGKAVSTHETTSVPPVNPTAPTLPPTSSPRTALHSHCLFEHSCPDLTESDEDVRASLAMGQALLEKLETASITSSRASRRLSTATPPPSISPNKLRSRRQSITLSRRSVDEENHSMAVYLRSSRLNRYLHLPRPFPERPLHVSLADVGSPSGTPVLFFLGIGCVRHLIALFDDLAKALNLRLICIDRWGFGKTTNVAQDRRNPLDWAAVVERVLDEINVGTFRIVAHSAGVPYAAATALRLGDRVQGKMHFLAPWVSAEIDGGYKWLKYVPNGVIKSAFAAEWKLQTYRLGKPPPLVHHPVSSMQITPTRPHSARVHSETPSPSSESQRSTALARRASQILGGKFEPPSTSPSRTTFIRVNPAYIPSEPSFGTNTTTSGSSMTSFQLKSPDQPKESFDTLSSNVADVLWLPLSPSKTRVADKPPTDAALLQALEQASHAECEPGTTDDIMTIILNRASLPWGFTYADLHHPATIWWGDQDERISERSVRWMERVMPAGTELKIVPGADHNLMRSVPVMCEIFQTISEEQNRL